jgi:hypothetical protein
MAMGDSSVRTTSGAGRNAIWLLAAALALPAATVQAQKDIGPRPLAAGERAGVELAAVYLAEGAEGWWKRLADDAQLKELGHDDAVKEIEVRAGPPAGA